MTHGPERESASRRTRDEIRRDDWKKSSRTDERVVMGINAVRADVEEAMGCESVEVLV